MTLRCALYARYSSDQQRAASIEDQFRICRERAAREGWKIAGACRDAEVSGDSVILRPGDLVVMDNLSSHKGPRGPQHDRRRRCATALPAALQSRPQSHRTGLLQAQGPGSAKPQSAPSTACGTPSDRPAKATQPTNAQTTSPPQDTIQNDRISALVSLRPALELR